MTKRKQPPEQRARQIKEAMRLAEVSQQNWHLIDDATKAKVIYSLQAALRDEDGWPLVYVNAETGRTYKPHNDRERVFVYQDGPRYALCKGGEGCVAAETVIDGVPIAERSEASSIPTLVGMFEGSAGYLKGQADLYKVRTNYGHDICVTLDHRFLVPLKWARLRDLSVGDPIYICDELGLQEAEIESVTFEKHGDYYDLAVPFWEHYVAHGLVHHNSGKSTAGIIKTLQRIRKGMSGILCSPNLPHLKRSAWPEFRRWCPWDRVVKKHQRFGKLDWEPHEPFNIVFKNDAILHCTGIENPGSLEGPNINFAHFDEARHHPDGKALKVLDGRVRIPGPRGQPPQIYLTTTPAMNWLFTYFGPLVTHDDGTPDDDYAAFKADSLVITLRTEENEPNLFEGFAQSRSQTLTEKEARVLLEAEWEDLTEGQPFLPDITWWDNCKDDLPPLDPREPMVLGLDAATGRTATSSDCFAIIGVTRHPERSDAIAVRYSRTWQVRAGQKIDYRGSPLSPGPERELLRLCGYDMDADGVPVQNGGGYNVLAVVYDPTELHDMSSRLYRSGVAWFKAFSQGILRNTSDRELLEMIKDRRVSHDGDPVLREHIRNADRKTDESGHRLRIVKRVDSLKVDLCVALSMAGHEAMRLNL